MSIQLTGDAMFARSVPGLFVPSDTWSFSIFFRYDGDPARAPGTDNLFTSTNWIAYYLGLSRLDQVKYPGQVGVGITIMESGNARVAGCPAPVPLACGTVYHLAATWARGLQTFYVNGIPSTIGRLTTRPKQGDDTLYLGYATSHWGKAPSPDSTAWSMRDQAIWCNYVLTPSDVAAIRDGRAMPDAIGAAASKRVWWKLDGPQGQPAVPGAGLLADSFGDGAYRFATRYGVGKATYGDPMAWVPSARLVGDVAESGTSVFTRCVATSNGARTAELSYTCDPTITIVGSAGGTDIPLTPTPWRGGDLEGQLYLIPAPYAVTSPDDRVTLSAPVGWCVTAAGIAGAEAATPLTNHFGKSIYGDVEPKVAFGLNFPWFESSAGSTYHLLRNFRHCASWFHSGLVGAFPRKPSALAKLGYYSDPITAANPALATIHDLTTSPNGIDLTGIPVPAGLWAVGWDDTGDPAHPTVLGLATERAGKRLPFPERADLYNPGKAGVGIVRVFDLSAVAATDTIRMTFWQDQLLPSFANDVVLMPGDFAYADGVPTTLDKSDPYAFMNILRSRLAGGCGSMRFVDSELDSYSSSNMCEPEHLQSMDDWSYQPAKKSWTIPAAAVRDWSIDRTPYIYSPNLEGLGESYTATLGADVATADAGTVGKINVPDANSDTAAATGPVMTGLILLAGAEKMRVLSVDPDGVTVTVERGACGTTPAAHAAGPIAVNYRHRLAGIADWGRANQGAVGSGNNVTTVVEVVTARRHDVQTGQFIPLTGFPTVTMTDGYVWPLNGDSQGTYVTGPTTFVRAYGGFDQKQNGLAAPATNVTLPAGKTIALPATANCNFYVPDSPILRYEVTAKLSSEFASDLQVNVPHAATDAYCYEVFRRIKAHLTPGRNVFVELSNEIWNPGYSQSQLWSVMDWMFYRGRYSWPAQYGYASHRSARVAAIAREVFAERAGEVRCILNTPTWGEGILPTIFKQWQAEGAPLDDIATAPYFEVDADTPAKVRSLHAMTPGQICDMMSWRFGFDRGGEVAGQKAIRRRVDDFNANVGGVNPSGRTLHLYGYEGGPGILYPTLHFNLNAACAATDTVLSMADAQLAPGMWVLLDATARAYEFQAASEWVQVVSVDPVGKTVTVTRGQSGTTARAHAAGARCRNWGLEYARDLDRHPQFASVMRDYMISLQAVGFERLNLYNYAMDYAGQVQCWGMYRCLGDAPGHGDGRPGSKDNRACVARPGQANTKPLNANHLLNTDNVRGQQFIDWNSRVNRAAFAAYAATHSLGIDDGTLLDRLRTDA